LAKASAAARPIPVSAPVINTICSLMILFLALSPCRLSVDLFVAPEAKTS
jgi:hypothetical protein